MKLHYKIVEMVPQNRIILELKAREFPKVLDSLDPNRTYKLNYRAELSTNDRSNARK